MEYTLHDIQKCAQYMLFMNIDEKFVRDIAILAKEFEGIYELMVMFMETEDRLERSQILDDLAMLRYDCMRNGGRVI